jgi:hypothetical protein
LAIIGLATVEGKAVVLETTVLKMGIFAYPPKIPHFR